MAKIFKKYIDISDGGLRYKIEREKTRKMHEVFSFEEFVTTPMLVDEDEENGVLIFDYVPNCSKLEVSLDNIWFNKIGRSLGLIHTSLELTPELSKTRETDFGREGLVFLHGDFTLGNIFISGNRLVIFDWGIRPWNQEVYTKAPPSVDLAAFIGSWIMTPWWDIRVPVDKLKKYVGAYLDFVGRNSLIGQLAGQTFEEELREQYDFVRLNVGREPLLKRVIHLPKALLNIWRVDNGIR